MLAAGDLVMAGSGARRAYVGDGGHDLRPNPHPAGPPAAGLLFYRVLELAAGHDPVRYRDLIASRRPRTAPAVPPGKRGHPPSMERSPAGRPWRAADMDYSG